MSVLKSRRLILYVIYITSSLHPERSKIVRLGVFPLYPIVPWIVKLNNFLLIVLLLEYTHNIYDINKFNINTFIF